MRIWEQATSEVHLVVWNGELRSDVNEGLCDKAALVCLNVRVPRDDSAALLDLQSKAACLLTSASQSKMLGSS